MRCEYEHLNIESYFACLASRGIGQIVERLNVSEPRSDLRIFATPVVIVVGRIDGHPLKSVSSQAPVTDHAETGGYRRLQIILGSHLYILLPHSQ